MRITILGAKTRSDDEILRTLEDAGFNVRAAIGYEWDGINCKFTQPPSSPSSGCKRCGIFPEAGKTTRSESEG